MNIEKYQHQIRVGISKVSHLWGQIWFKIFLVAAIVFVLINKNLSLNFNLSGGEQYTENQYKEPVTETPVVITKEVEKETKVVPKIVNNKEKMEISIFDFGYLLMADARSFHDDNRVNNFSNIGLVINPEFVKKHKVDPAIVKEKQNIVNTYINTYKGIAKAEEKKYGIPASITIAQGLLESDAGGSRLARNNNNHFGIKCFSRTCKKGHCVNYTDDSHKDFFRNFDSTWGSFRSHSVLLQKPRYKALYKLKTTDYKGWAEGLRKAGYATDKRYGKKLIKIIEILNLDEL